MMGTIVGESFDRFSSNKRQRYPMIYVKRQKTSETSSQQVAQRIQILTFPGEESGETKFPDRVTVFPQEVWFSIFSASSLQTCGRLARSNYGASVAWHDFRIHVMVQSLNVLPLSVPQKQLVNNLSDYQAMTYYQGQFFVKSGKGNITNEPFNLVDPNLMLLHFRKLPFYKHSQEDLHFFVGFDKKYFNTFVNVYHIRICFFVKAFRFKKKDETR